MKRAFVVLAFLLIARPAAAHSACPGPDDLAIRLVGLDLDRGSRGTRFESHVPRDLYRKAARNAGRPAVEREGKKGYGVLLAKVPIERFWRAVSDENRHVGFAPVDGSQIIEGSPGSSGRLVFQYAKMFGIGRWWVSRVRMNDALYRESGGQLWESWWTDDFAAVDPAMPPMNEVAGDLPPIESSRGAWLLVDLGNGCTLVELFSWSEAGGSVGAIEGLAVVRSMRVTLKGMLDLASEEPATPPASGAFVRPDGSPLTGPSPAAARAGSRGKINGG